MTNIIFTHHALKRIHERAGIKKRALQKTLLQHIDSSRVIEAISAPYHHIRRMAEGIQLSDKAKWCTYDINWKLLLVWNICNNNLILVTALYPENDPRWQN